MKRLLLLAAANTDVPAYAMGGMTAGKSAKGVVVKECWKVVVK